MRYLQSPPEKVLLSWLIRYTIRLVPMRVGAPRRGALPAASLRARARVTEARVHRRRVLRLLVRVVVLVADEWVRAVGRCVASHAPFVRQAAPLELGAPCRGLPKLHLTVAVELLVLMRHRTVVRMHTAATVPVPGCCVGLSSRAVRTKLDPTAAAVLGLPLCPRCIIFSRAGVRSRRSGRSTTRGFKERRGSESAQKPVFVPAAPAL